MAKQPACWASKLDVEDLNERAENKKRAKEPQRNLSKRPDDDVDTELTKAIEFYQLGQLSQAKEICKRVLRTKSAHGDALHLLGAIAHQLGETDRAVQWIERATESDPGNPIYLNSLGNVFQELGEFAEAIRHYQKALDLKLDYVEVHYNLGNAFQGQGELDNAVSSYRKALQLNPDYADAYNNMGSTLQRQGRLDEAMASYQQALRLNPDSPKTYINLGNAFQDQGKLEHAIQCYQDALGLEPDLAVAHNNLGTAFHDQGRVDEAITCFQQSIQLDPAYGEAYYNLGNAFQDQGRLEEAISCYERALELEPEDDEACDGLIHAFQQTCAWQKLEGLAAKLDALTDKAIASGNRTGEAPLVNLSRHADPAHNFAVATSWSRDIVRRVSKVEVDFSFVDRRRNKGRITVGYLSHDFSDHPVANLMASLYGLHDRSNFRIFCYSTGKDDGSSYRKRIRRNCDRFIELCHLGHSEAAMRIYKDRVDILVDLNGHTEGSRLEICALRPAPVQVTYLGFPGTTGADFLDYIITDRIVTPVHHANYFAESLVYMPHCYMVSDNSQRISDKNWKKADFRLREDGFIFSSFNQSYKIDPKMFDTWMKILHEVPEGFLWLQQLNETAQRNLRGQARERGVDPDRLIFAEKMALKEEHLARLRVSDLALDTRMYNGHVTTNDALWAGVPVITLEGTHFASRVSSSILTAIGLPGLVTHTLEEYRVLAIRLAQNPDELEGIRQRLAGNRLTKPLFDTPRFARNLERAYKEMWNIFLAGEHPRQITVAEG